MNMRRPKTLDVPSIEDLRISEDLKQWLREFAAIVQRFVELLGAEVDAVESDVDVMPVGPSEIVSDWRWFDDGTHTHIQHYNHGTSIWDTQHTFEDASGPLRFSDTGADLLIQIREAGLWRTIRLCEGVTGTYRWLEDAVGLNLQVYLAGEWVTKWTIEL